MKYRHVVILGGGFAGPLMAIAVSPHAERITLVERYSREPEEEWLGTPQSHHGHYLTLKGQKLLEKLLPGVLQELRAHGAHEIDWAKNTSWTNQGGVTPLYESQVTSLLFSRKLLDRMVFGKAAALTNLTVVKAAVDELEFKDSRVQSVRLSHGQFISDPDLVIDTRGRTARMRERLQAVVGPIPERSIKNNIIYHTLSFDQTYDPTAKVQQYFRQPDLSNGGIGYFASPVEGNRLAFTLSDYYGNRSSRPFETLKNHPLLEGRSLSNPHIFTNLSSVHTQYGKARNWIANYLIVGDAVCRLNPVFAHGMTVALEMVTVFREQLLKKDRISTHQLQQRFDRLVLCPWAYAQMDSIRTRENPAPAGIRVLRGSIRVLFLMTSYDRAVHLTFLRVVQLVASPLAFLSPFFLIRVLTNLVFRGWTIPHPPAEQSLKIKTEICPSGKKAFRAFF